MPTPIDDLQDLERKLLALHPEGAVSVRKGRIIPTRAKRRAFYLKEGKRLAGMTRQALRYIRQPVGVREFVESPEYLAMPGVLYPKVLDELEELNSDKYIEAVLTGGIGTGKTTIALFTTAYQLYLLSCLKNPHGEFGLSPTDEIVFIFQSLNASLAKSVDYMRFREMIQRSPYFSRHFMFNKGLESELRFPRRIIVKPVSGQHTAALGNNVFGGVIDEIDFMAVVEKSKQNRGESYDQAWENYRSIVRRRESRFMVKGSVPGMLCLVSSKNYPGAFTDKKEAEARDPKKRIFVYNKRVWEVKPEGTFSEQRFAVFIGDALRKPRILAPGEEVDQEDRALVMLIPDEYRHSFDEDLLSALRDIAGVSTLALHPFFHNVEKVSEAFGRTASVLSRDDCDFVSTKVAIYPKRFQKPEEPRFLHIDLAISGDSAGVACGFVDGFVAVPRGDKEVEMLPKVVFDFVLEVKPPKGGEINFEKIRALLYKVREWGMNLRWVSLDSFQSTDTMQILQQRGFVTGYQSVDTTTVPYDITKTALYDGRVLVPPVVKAQRELAALERDRKTNKIDHPPNGSKDLADAMAGVVYGLTMRREIWVRHNIPLTSVPSSVKEAANISKSSVDGRSGQKTIKE